MRKFLHLSLWFILCLLVSFLVTFPAGLLWKLAEPRIAPLLGSEIKVQQPSGLWWNGQLVLQSSLDRGELQWQIRFSDLLRGRLSLSLNYQSSLASLDSLVAFNNKEAYIYELSGYVRGEIINTKIKPYGSEFTGTVWIDSFSMDLAPIKEVASARGELRMPQGVLQYRLGRNTQEYNLPPMTATFSSTTPNTTQFVLADQAATELVTAELESAGLLAFSVKRALVEVIGLPYPGRQAVIFSGKTQVYDLERFQ